MDAPHPLAGLRWPRPTDRTSLQPAEPDDVEAVWAYRRRSDVGRWLGGHTEDLDAFREWYAARRGWPRPCSWSTGAGWWAT